MLLCRAVTASDGGDPEEAERWALAASITCALDFIQESSPEDIAAEMPPQYAGENPDLYVKAIAELKDADNPGGDITDDGAQAVRDVLAAMDLAIAGADVDVAQTYPNEFLQKCHPSTRAGTPASSE